MRPDRHRACQAERALQLAERAVMVEATEQAARAQVGERDAAPHDVEALLAWRDEELRNGCDPASNTWRAPPLGA